MQIEDNKTYTLSEVLSLNILPWKSHLTLRKWIDADAKHDNHLKVIKVGKGVATRYYIKGINLKMFIASLEDGSFSDRVTSWDKF